jgi:hypothetical protein
MERFPIMRALHFVFVASLILSFCEARAYYARKDETTEAELDLNSILQVDVASPKQHRQIQQQAPPCNEVEETLTLAQLSDRLSTAIDTSSTPGGFQNSFLRSSFLAKLKYGIEVRRICAGCQDVTSDSPVFDEFCGTNVYGSGTLYSGIVMLPLTEQGTVIPGTLKGVLEMHTSSSYFSPSIAGGSTSLESLLNAVIASTGNVLLFPDYMGYADSASEVFKAYIVRTAYETATVPLWLYLQEYVRERTDCQTALGNAVLTKGYSEGGYSSVVAADVLHRMGVDIIGVQSGGGPFRIGSQAILRIVQAVDAGTLPARYNFILALLGAAYSSTYEGLANYQQGQDMLAPETRQKFVDLVTASTPEDDINAQIPTDDPLSLFDPALISFVRTGIAANNFDVCAAGDNLEAAGVGLLCQALEDNDLIALLASVEYPVDVCHSPDDELVAHENVPDFTVNPTFVSYVAATGSHNEAGAQCILTSLLYATSSDFSAITPPAAHFPGGCASATPSFAPTNAAATPAPTSGAWSIPHHVFGTTFVMASLLTLLMGFVY